MSDFDDSVSIIVNNQSLIGWKNVRVTRGIEIMPSNFSISATEKYPNAPDIDLEPDQPFVMMFGSDVILTGYIGSYTSSASTNSHDIGITGSSKCVDLTTCSAVLKKPSSSGDASVIGTGVIQQSTFNQIATTLCQPFEITTSGVSSSVTIPQQVFNLGETPFDILERLSRFAQVLLYDDVNGNLVIAQVGTERHSSGFIQGDNVYSYSVSFNNTQRFSDVYVLWQNWNSSADQTASNIQNQRGYARDPAITRYKPLIVISEQVQNGIDLGQKRAAWEINRRRGRSQTITIECDSWRDSSGKLWTPNMLAPINIPLAKIENQTWLISEVTYNLSEASGTSASVTLMPPDAFDIEPVTSQLFNWDVNSALNETPKA